VLKEVNVLYYIDSYVFKKKASERCYTGMHHMLKKIHSTGEMVRINRS
jgi:hypothetical protein